MVKRYNHSPSLGKPPADGASDAQRKVSGGPLHSQIDVQKLLSTTSLNLWTRECQREVRNLDLDLHGVASLIMEAFQYGRFKNSEWCEQTTDGPWALCDAYVLNKKEWNEYAYKYLDCEYYIKFAIADTGSILLVISCHT